MSIKEIDAKYKQELSKALIKYQASSVILALAMTLIVIFMVLLPVDYLTITFSLMALVAVVWVVEEFRLDKIINPIYDKWHAEINIRFKLKEAELKEAKEQIKEFNQNHPYLN